MKIIIVLVIIIVVYFVFIRNTEKFILNSTPQPSFDTWTKPNCELEEKCSRDTNNPLDVKFIIDNFSKCRNEAFVDPCESPNFNKLNAAYCFPESNSNPCNNPEYLNSPQGKEFCCRTKHHFEYDIKYDEKGNQIDAKRTPFDMTFDYSKNFMKNNYDKCVSLGYTPCNKESDTTR